MPDPSPSDGSTPTGDDPEVIDLTDPSTLPAQYAGLPIVIDDVDLPTTGPTAGYLDQAPPPADVPITPITIGEILASFDEATDDEFDDADFVANPLAGLEDEEMDDASEDESDSDDDDDAFFHHIELLRLRSYFGALPRAQARSIMRSLGKDELTTIIMRVEPDWRMLEAIQIVVHSNLLPLRHHDRWGKLFHVPRKPEESFRDYRERRALELTIPSGWDMSRGQEMDLNNLQPAVTNGWQPHDWARVEGSWIGTYFFLNYSCFLSHNIRKAEMMEKRGVHSIDPENHDRFDVDKERPPSLLQHEEAVGDLLQFKAKIIDPEVGRKQYSHGPVEAEEDPRYPTLYFRGTHMAYEEDAEPMPRSTCHGWVRPVFEGGATPETRQICGLQWRIISAYAGGDRWSMSGFQCGQPGTKAPILGTWTDANHDANSPSGPFCFWRVGDDTWAQRDEALQEEHDSV